MNRPADTTIEAHRVHVALMREAPGFRKLELAAELCEDLTSVALAGLKARHEGAPESELRRRLVDILLVAELAERAYGPMSPSWDVGGFHLGSDRDHTSGYRVLEAHQIRYAVGGSVASSLHGVFRASVDVDIVADLRQDHVDTMSHSLGVADLLVRTNLEARD